MKKKILIIRLGSLGDIVLSSATVINLKINYPESYIVYFCKEKYCFVVNLIEGVDEIVTLPDKISGIKYFNFLLKLNKKNFDVVIDLHGNLRSWLARILISAGKKVTYPKRRWERILSVKKKILPKFWLHTIDLYNITVKQLDGKPFCKRPLLKPAESGLNEDVKLLSRSHSRIIVIAPGAAHSNKQWHIERFCETAVKLHRSEKAGIIWAITDAEKGLLSPVNEIDKSSFLQLIDYPIEKLADIISKASLTIANDSGITHISSAVGTPVMAIFGPTHPVLGFAPRGLYDRVIEVEEPCRPCSLHGKKECYREQRYCFNRIDATNIFNTASEILKEDVKSKQAVLVDRDGTIIVDKHFLADPEMIEFEEGSIDALKIIQELGYKIVIISNQSGVARGLINIQSVEKVNARLMELLIEKQIFVDAFYYCPHFNQGMKSLYSKDCNCRKPSAGMAEEAAFQFGLNLRKSYVIGDKLDDVN
ncbi:MAG: HAD-IIIA family hydrolase, partial [Candidatus Zixiibacteriota bacterium]